jgi:G:T-mismatch repair DNA endonuclease (very short patch repair protein)
MADIFSRKKHSAVMSAIRSRGNAATELRLLALFRAHGITGWRRGASLTVES